MRGYIQGLIYAKTFAQHKKCCGTEQNSHSDSVAPADTKTGSPNLKSPFSVSRSGKLLRLAASQHSKWRPVPMFSDRAEPD